MCHRIKYVQLLSLCELNTEIPLATSTVRVRSKSEFRQKIAKSLAAKGGFFSESATHFSNLPISKIKIFQKTILRLTFEFVVYCLGRKFKFQVQDSFLEYFYLGDLKNTSHFLKKATFK